MRNPFNHRDAARRYAHSRPRVHRTALRAFREACGWGSGFSNALDVACGTGHSSSALAQMSDAVVGIDISMPMLAEAEQGAAIKYVCSAAEEMPFGRGVFDLVSVGLAFHWFDQHRFLAEANRVMEANQWLILYNSWFSGDMSHAPTFRRLGWERYLAQFPTPPRESTPITAWLAQAHGFELVGSREFEDWIALSRNELIAYFSTQSNVVLVVESGTLRYEAAEAAIREIVAPFFARERHQFRFPGIVWFLRKRGSA